MNWDEMTKTASNLMKMKLSGEISLDEYVRGIARMLRQ